MTNPTKRKLRINLEILRTLDECDGFLMPEDSLRQQVSLGIRPMMLVSEFEDCLKGLEATHFVVGVPDELGGPAKWKLTDLGKAKLRDNR